MTVLWIGFLLMPIWNRILLASVMPIQIRILIRPQVLHVVGNFNFFKLLFTALLVYIGFIFLIIVIGVIIFNILDSTVH
jgi:hypothetical protein